MQNLLLSTRIKEQCKIKKLAVKTLLEKCNMNRNTIYDLENKSSFPSSDRLSRIADYLDCSTDFLLGRTDNPLSHKMPYEGNLSVSPSQEMQNKKTIPPADFGEIAAEGGELNRTRKKRNKETTL